MQAVIHISPQVPPAICGVGDYAAVVGRRMEELCPEVRCCYLAAGHRAAGVDAEADADRAVRVRSLGGACDGAALWGAVEELAEEPSPSPSLRGSGIAEAAVVLHYSGYGYDPSGAPAWLAEALERRPAHLADVRVATFFHELYATGKPWQRAFWTSGRQRAAAIRVARASDALMTNREQSARWLERHAGLPAGSVPHVPICSNVGEPTELVPWDEQPLRAVTFGAAAFKRFALRDDAERVAAMLGRLGIVELVDIGESTAIATESFARHGVRVDALGKLPAADVSVVLGASRLGFLDYPPSFAAKSGVFAAFAAHGVAPVLRAETAAPGNGLAYRRHYFCMDDERAIDAGELRDAATMARQWYVSHDSRRHAEMLHRAASFEHQASPTTC